MFYIALLFCQMHFVFYFGSLFIHLTYEGEPYVIFSSWLYCREMWTSKLILTCVLKLVFIQWIYCTDLFLQMFWVNGSSDNFLFFHVQNSNVKFMRYCIERPWYRVLTWKSQIRTFTLIFLFSLSVWQCNVDLLLITLLCCLGNMIWIWVVSASNIGCKTTHINKLQAQYFIHYIIYLFVKGRLKWKVKYC